MVVRRKLRWIAVATSTASALVAWGGASPVLAAARAPAPCTDRADAARPLTLRVKGKPAKGRFALPARAPRTLVVYAHGYGHTSASWVKHMRLAARHGLVAVTMDYRGLKISKDSNGDGLPESRGFNIMAGSEDLIAAARTFEARCRSIDRIVLFSVSLGGNVGGVALARAAALDRPADDPLFDDWINVEGLVNLTETSTEARALAPVNGGAAEADEDIQAECGGTIEEVPDAYLERTVVARVPEIAASGLRSAVVIHSIDDGLVPYDQAREMATLLAAAGVATDMVTIGRRSPESERETTLSGNVGSQLDPDYTSPLTGHASEKSSTHIVMVTAFERLWALLDGDTPGPYREFVVDGEMGTFPPA